MAKKTVENIAGGEEKNWEYCGWKRTIENIVGGKENNREYCGWQRKQFENIAGGKENNLRILLVEKRTV